jgi:charged multivesicular body protein 7
MLDAFRVGTSTLKDVTRKWGLDVDNVNSVMNDLADTLADQKEIDEAMTSGMQSIPGMEDTEELEEELEKLMESEVVVQQPQEDDLVSQLNSLKIANSPLPKTEASREKQLA